MGMSLTTPVLLSFMLVGFIHHVNMSLAAPLEDQEGSGFDLEGSGSGSGDWSDQADKMKNTDDQPNSSKDVRILSTKTEDGEGNSLQGSQVLNFDKSEYVIVAGRSFMENQQIINAVIAGGVTGLLLAAALAALLIYTWQKKDNGGYVLRQKKASDQDYYRPTRQQAVF